MSLKALIFDVDGTLADTEEAHRQAFNSAFREHGLAFGWDRATYGGLLWVTGGKERIERYIDSLQLAPSERWRLKRLVASIHAAKTRAYARQIEAGEVRLRPGIERLIAEARASGVALAIASTTTPANVESLIAATLGREALSWFRAIATGDVVPNKKPAPDIYLLALARLGLPAAQCAAFEDSETGVRAAKAARLFTVATPTWWSAAQSFGAADLVLPSLGEPGRPLDEAAESRIGAKFLGLAQLRALHSAALNSVRSMGA